MVSEDYVICPYCKNRHFKSRVIGQSGLINLGGYKIHIHCDRCSKEFSCIIDVKVRYKTKKCKRIEEEE